MYKIPEFHTRSKLFRFLENENLLKHNLHSNFLSLLWTFIWFFNLPFSINPLKQVWHWCGLSFEERTKKAWGGFEERVHEAGRAWGEENYGPHFFNIYIYICFSVFSVSLICFYKFIVFTCLCRFFNFLVCLCVFVCLYHIFIVFLHLFICFYRLSAFLICFYMCFTFS